MDLGSVNSGNLIGIFAKKNLYPMREPMALRLVNMREQTCVPIIIQDGSVPMINIVHCKKIRCVMVM